MLLITGGSEMLGRHFIGLKPTHNEFDIMIKNVSAILHCAVYYHPDVNNTSTKKYLDINIYGVINITKLAKRLDIPLIFISSSCVFF